MEGPSLFLAAEQLKPFIDQTIVHVDGNTKIGKERLLNKTILNIFSWGKHLVFQFEEFALRVHFMLYGSFEATLHEKKITGDYPTKNRTPRLELVFDCGKIDLYSCSLKFLESSHAQELYDFTVDTMSDAWNGNKAFKKLLVLEESQIADALLDQTIFSGVGNIIRNEVLFLEKIRPTTPVKELSHAKLKAIIKRVRQYVFQFYEWRKAFILKQHYQVYRRSICPICGSKITRQRTGLRQRISFFCPSCQSQS